MHEERPAARPVRSVRSARQIAVTDTKAEPEAVENAPHLLLGSGVPLANTS